jgi:hypothetical protein
MPSPRKLKKRPCTVCRRWFLPEPRVAHCQKTCGPDCRKAHDAKQQAKWRGKNPDYRQDRQLRAKLDQAGQPGATIEIRPPTAPLARLPWGRVQMALGVKTAVLLAFALRLQHGGRQMAFEVKIRVPPPSPDRHAPMFEKMAMEPGP